MNSNTLQKRRLAVLLPALFLPTVSAVIYFVLMKESAFAQTLYVSTKIFTVVWPLIAVGLILKCRPVWKRVPLRQHLQALPLGALIGAGIVLIMVLWMHSPLNGLIERGAPAVREKVATLGFADHFIPFATFISVAHSLIEEIYWRWFVYGQLRELITQKKAHALAALAFTGHHLVVTSQFFPIPFACFLSFCVGIGGLIWSQLYQRQGTLAGAWLSHMIVDVGLMWVGWRLLNSPIV